MADIHCRKCKSLVLMIREGIGRVARRQRSNMSWPDGHQVKPDGILSCRVCGDEFMFVDVLAAETVGAEQGQRDSRK